MSAANPYLFVYGTLRRNSPHPMAAFLARNGRFVGLAKTAGRLYDLGPYPGMLPALHDNDWVQGDLYELDDAETVLADLDRYEECPLGQPEPELFRRELAAVTALDGGSYRAWVYFYCRAVMESQRIASGVFSYEPEA